MSPGWLRPELTANGRLAIQEFSDYIDSSRRKPFHLDGELKLIPRESC